jgi:importin subunit alpha-1
MILDQGTLDHIVQILATTEDHWLIKDATWALSNLCRGNPEPQPSKVSGAIPVLCGIVKMGTNSEAIFEAARALVSISQAESQIQAVIATGVVPSLIKYLK